MNGWQGVFLAAVLTAGAATAAEVGSLIKADELKAEPFIDARALAPLPRDSTVQILARQGGWLKVIAGRNEGWVRLLSVRRGQAASSSSSAEAKGLLDLASGRSASGQIVSTTGVRGLSVAELKQAKFSAKELNRVESYRLRRNAAQNFAKAGDLASRRMEYLPEPK
jgi:hypothetical protein